MSIVKRFDGNPILTKKDVPYPVATVHNAGVVKHNGKYIMLFRSHRFTGRSILGLARSDDGFKFKVDPEPFMIPSTEPGFAEYEEYSTLQKSHLYHFRKNFMGFELESENHIQRVYRNTELLQMIESSPFKLIALHATETPQNLINKRNSPLDEKYPRLFFVLQRGD